jgi:hypothetical protein
LLVFSVKDLAQAKTLFDAYLGAEPYVDESYYVGYRIGDQEDLNGLLQAGMEEGASESLDWLEKILINIQTEKS